MIAIVQLEHAGPADSWSYQPQRLQKRIGYVKKDHDGLLHRLIRYALASLVGCPAGEAIQGELQGE